MKYNVIKIYEYGVIQVIVDAENTEKAEELGLRHDLGALCDIEIERSEQ